MKKYKKVFDGADSHPYSSAKRGGRPPNTTAMKQVVCHIEDTEHAALKQRATAEKRTIGQQLVYEALKGALAPAPTGAQPKRGRKAA